jgi:hypothetical protein
MGSMKRKQTIIKSSARSLSWLPIDSRLIVPLFAFGHVKGLAKVFLVIEMALAGLVVTGTMVLMILSVFH